MLKRQFLIVCSAFGGPEIAVYKRTNSVLLTGIQPRNLFGKTA